MSNDESFLDLGTNLDDVPDVTTVPEGEYQLQISDLGITETEKGKFLIPKFGIVGMPDTKTISHPLRIPDPNKMEDKELNQRKRAIKYFYKAFGIPTEGPVVFAEQVGKTGYATLREDDDPKYGRQNSVRAYSVPK
jgi:hypothetical protein